MSAGQLKIVEIFRSIQGESTFAGYPCVFVRLAGCNLRCAWCDTTYALEGGISWSTGEVLQEALRLGGEIVEVTGGEPLLQEQAVPLMERLLEAGRTVLLETSGAVSIADVPRAVHKIMDLKAPGSGQCEENLWENLHHLQPHDEIKIVIGDRPDYEWARDVARRRDLLRRCRVVNLSPAEGLMAPARLAEWILEDGLPFRLNLQLHRSIWPERDRGV